MSKSVSSRVVEASKAWTTKRKGIDQLRQAAEGREEECIGLLLDTLKALSDAVSERLVAEYGYDTSLVGRAKSAWLRPPTGMSPQKKREGYRLVLAWSEMSNLHNLLANLSELGVTPTFALDRFLDAARHNPPYLMALQARPTSIAPDDVREWATVQLAAWTRGSISQRNQRLRESLKAIHPGTNFGVALAAELPGAVLALTEDPPSPDFIRSLPTKAAALIAQDRADSTGPRKRPHAWIDTPLAEDGIDTIGDMQPDPANLDPLEAFLGREEVREREARVARFMDSLSQRERELANLLAEQMSDADAAAAMGVPKANVYNWRSRMKVKWENSA